MEGILWYLGYKVYYKLCCLAGKECNPDFMLYLGENARKKFLRMAKLVAAGKLPEKTFRASYNAWKNHISHGNCYRLGQQMDREIERILSKEESI